MDWFGVVGIVVGVFGIVAALYFGIKTLSRKRMTAYLLKFESTLKVTSLIKKTVEIKFKKKRISSLERIQLVLKNTGNRGIKMDDMDGPLRIKVESPAEIIELRHHSANFQEYQVTSKKNELVLEFKLMNPGELIAVEFLTTNAKSSSLYVICRGTDLNFEWIESGKKAGKYFVGGLIVLWAISLGLLGSLPKWFINLRMFGSLRESPFFVIGVEIGFIVIVTFVLFWLFVLFLARFGIAYTKKYGKYFQ